MNPKNSCFLKVHDKLYPEDRRHYGNQINCWSFGEASWIRMGPWSWDASDIPSNILQILLDEIGKKTVVKCEECLWTHEYNLKSKCEHLYEKNTIL